MPLSVYAGTHTNFGYGTFTLYAPASASSYCASVHSAFQTVDGAHTMDGAGASDVQQLTAAWPQLRTTHVRLVLFEEAK